MKYITYEISDEFDAAINNINHLTKSLSSTIVINSKKYQITLEVVEANVQHFSGDLNWMNRFRESLETMCRNVSLRSLEYVTFSTYAIFDRYSYNVVAKISQQQENKKINKKKEVKQEEIKEELLLISEEPHE